MEQDAKHILVVDDDTRLRNLLQRFLRENSYLVSTAKDAEEARFMMQQYKFNLLIVDIMMPKESGLEFLSKLRVENSIPVIMLCLYLQGKLLQKIFGLEPEPLYHEEEIEY